MSRLHVFKLLLVAGLLVGLVGAVISHAAHLGLGEWLVVAVLAWALVTTLVGGLRRAT